MSKDTLFKEFDAVSLKAWKQQIQVDLKGADYNKTLVWDTPDGIKVKPIYHADDLEKSKPLDIPPTSSWNIGQQIFASESKKANKKAIDAIKRGAESLVLIIPNESLKIEELLKDINLVQIPVFLELRFLSFEYIKKVDTLAYNSKANVFLNIDIIGNLARTGNWFMSMEQDHAVLDQILRENKACHVFGIDTTLYQNAGANRVQQLAYAMAQANEYLNHLRSSKQSYPAKFNVMIAVDTDYFFEIAKIRSFKLLWNALMAEYDADIDCQITAVPTKRNKTVYDYNVNLLRTTTECMAAVLGGAHTVCNTAYDSIYHKDNEFGERIARNQLLILKGESYFDKVSNPANGSYYIEDLTRQLAEKALLLFKEIEKNGGFLKHLKAHTIQRKIKETSLKEAKRFEEGSTVLVGSNKFMNDQDKMKDEMELYPFVKTKARKTLIEPIIEKRLTEALEQKRLDHE